MAGNPDKNPAVNGETFLPVIVTAEILEDFTGPAYSSDSLIASLTFSSASTTRASLSAA